MTPAGIEPATFRFVAQHLNHCATMAPTNSDRRNGIFEIWFFHFALKQGRGIFDSTARPAIGMNQLKFEPPNQETGNHIPWCKSFLTSVNVKCPSSITHLHLICLMYLLMSANYKTPNHITI